MKIAGHTAKVISLFESTPQYFRAYLSEEPPEFTITVSREQIDFEQADLLEEAHRDGFRPRVFTDPFLERAAIQRAFAEFLIDFRILLLHGSAIAVDDEGFLFTAHSGTGKSTHTRLWREVFGQRAIMVNDDKPFVEIGSDGVFLYGSPWSGKHGLDSNVCVPLRGICLLERGQDNRIAPISVEALLPMLRKQAYCPLSSEKHPCFLQLTKELANRVSLWQMACNRNPDAPLVAWEAMRSKNA